MECPRCDRGVGFVVFPTLKETELAAAQGNNESIRDLPEKRAWIKRLENRMARFEKEKLRSPDQLPELAGECLEFTCELVQQDDEHFQVIQTGVVEVWRELAFWDHVPRFHEIMALLKEKHGSRFKSLTPTYESLDWWTGDHYLKAAEIIET